MPRIFQYDFSGKLEVEEGKLVVAIQLVKFLLLVRGPKDFEVSRANHGISLVLLMLMDILREGEK